MWTKEVCVCVGNGRASELSVLHGVTNIRLVFLPISKHSVVRFEIGGVPIH